MTDQPRRLGGIVVLGMVALLVVFAVSYTASRLALANFASTEVANSGVTRMMGSGGGGSDMMGSGGMMGSSSPMGGAAQSATPATIRVMVSRLAAAAIIDRRTNTIIYRTQRVHLVALASPDGGPDMTWNIDGLVNPTVVIPRGAHVTVEFFNSDKGTWHGWELTTAPPPYSIMAMMSAPFPSPGAFAMPVPGATTSRWYGRTIHFTAAQAGAYFYLCPVPGHAARGMYGKLIVSQAGRRP